MACGASTHKGRESLSLPTGRRSGQAHPRASPTCSATKALQPVRRVRLGEEQLLVRFVESDRASCSTPRGRSGSLGVAGSLEAEGKGLWRSDRRCGSERYCRVTRLWERTSRGVPARLGSSSTGTSMYGLSAQLTLTRIRRRAARQPGQRAEISSDCTRGARKKPHLSTFDRAGRGCCCPRHNYRVRMCGPI